MASAVSAGLSADMIERSSFTQEYSVGEGEDRESRQCVICIADFQLGAKVRRLACLHIFHISCVDAWLMDNRCCPVCRLDIEEAAAQFR